MCRYHYVLVIWLDLFQGMHLSTTSPLGHLQPLGSHQPPNSEGIIVYTKVLEPEIFWRDHVMPSKPALFAGVAKKLDAFKLWKDEYLGLHYGHLEVNVEITKTEDRKIPPTTMPLSEFLRLYKTKSLYMVTPLHYEFLYDLAVPKSLQCGNFQRALAGQVGWLSSGGTKSVLHTDSLDNFLCVLDGTKHFFLVDRQKINSGIIDNIEEAYSSVDVNKVDLYKFPGLQNIPWYNATANKGDCIFIPYRWPHYVSSSGGRNSAVSLWFHHILWFNYSDCLTTQLNEFVPFYKFDTPDKDQQIQYELITMSESDSPQLTVKRFAQLYLFPDINSVESVMKLFNQLDVNKDGRVSFEEMYSCDSKLFASFFKGYGSHSTHVHTEL